MEVRKSRAAYLCCCLFLLFHFQYCAIDIIINIISVTGSFLSEFECIGYLYVSALLIISVILVTVETIYLRTLLSRKSG